MTKPWEQYQPESEPESAAKPWERFSAEEPKAPPTAGSRVKAAVAGVNRGFFGDLVGLPVDTVTNVLDLGKAAIGYGASKVTGKAPPEWTAPSDRSQVVGTGEWNARKINDIGLGDAINNPNPDDAVSRVLHTGGRVAGASVTPMRNAAISLPQNAANMGKGFVSGVAAGTVGEFNPEYAGVAGMLPQLMSKAGAAGIKRIVRGGESGRQAMEQRMQDLRNGGIEEPSAGLASGNRALMGVENILSQTPMSAGLYEAARLKNLDGMKAKTAQVRDTVSRTHGAVESGNAIQSDLKNLYKERINTTYSELNDRFAGTVPPDKRFAIDGTRAALNDTTAINPMAPNTTAGFVQPRIAKLRDNILADTTVPVPGMYQNSTKNIGLPLSAIKDVRTDIGKEAASRAIFGTPEQADFKQLYSGLSKDMKSAAQVTDRNAGPQPNNIGPAETALNRANNYYSKGMKRADDLSSLANNATPEGAHNSLVNSLNNGGTLYSKLRNSVSPETRGKIVATVIDDMGNANPGQQNATGEAWSPRTFLTNYNKIEPGARAELFKRIPGGDKMATNLSEIAKTTDMLGESSKIWANPSGTGAALSARATLGGLTVGALWHPLTAAGAASGLVLANQTSQRLLLNPKFVNWLAKAPRQATKAQVMAYSQRLIANAKMTNDKQFQQDAQEYVDSIEQPEQDE